MPATLPLFWKTRQRLMASVLVLAIFFISLASGLSEFMPARANSPLWHGLQASMVHTSDGPAKPFVPPVISTPTNTDVPTTTATDPSKNPSGADTSTPTDTYPTSTDYPPSTDYPTSTDYPPSTSNGPVADQPSYPVTTQPDPGSNNGITTQPTNLPSTQGSNPNPTQPTNPTQPAKSTATPTPTPVPTAPPTTTDTPTPTATPTPTDTPPPTDTPSPTDTPVSTGPCTANSPTATATSTAPVKATPTAPGNPVLSNLVQVTNRAFGADGSTYVPNSWGVQKSRIVRTSKDIFTVYISAGTDLQNRTWHLMHLTSNGHWEELKNGDAGTEPINILVGPNDELHLFTWPGTQGKLVHLYSKDLGNTFEQEDITGNWSTDQGYSGATIDAKGDMVIYQTSQDIPGQFLWSYYSASDGKWTFHTNTLDCRYTYAFFFLGENNDLTITAMRDVKRQELGLTASSGFDYIFNAIGYFYIKDVTVADPQMSFFKVTEVQPKNTTDYDVTYLTDSYIDTQGRVHILYNNLYNGPHHAIIENGQIVKDVKLDISLGTKARITQDSQGHFYVITMSKDGNSLNVYPGTSNDTDGTQLMSAVSLPISSNPGCADDDFCHSPTFTVPRSGNTRSDVVDGVYGNHNDEIYFQINLRGQPKS
ncbi:hypothetical protein KDH_03500 [Dictyobacter sp. S3.2.2.5]|uniref:Sialidase domain-containing protein n=1 Tax=Dictyobacter halimunensis TaxID=3026934 RepID=A0ABQ6FHG4_9CHLR|nr:hypothetical protein KDH_03500 [Dictyobacter sp. S3.2.2.5]